MAGGDLPLRLMKSILLVAAGGALGASARHLVSQASLRAFGSGWPHGTVIANVAGALLMGLLAGWLAFKAQGGANLHLFLGVGLLGGFTTFSAYSLEAAMMLERKHYVTAGAYAFGSVLACVTAIFLGLMIARRLFA